MIETDKLTALLSDIAVYFRECRQNASFAGRSENHLWEMQNAASEAAELLRDPPPRVLTLDEILATAGGGWAEDWIPADLEDGTPEMKVLRQAAWCHGCVIDDTCSSTDPENLRSYYMQRYGTRIWTARPTERQTEAAPWQ